MQWCHLLGFIQTCSLVTPLNTMYNPKTLDSSSTLNSVNQLHHLMEAASAEKVKKTNKTTSTPPTFHASFVKNKKNTIASSPKKSFVSQRYM